jgi:reactive chlorine resistance protein C
MREHHSLQLPYGSLENRSGSLAPQLSAIGSLLAAGIFVVTLSFLFTTPGALSPTDAMGGFLMKDLSLLGAALYTAAEALSAARSRLS